MNHSQSRNGIELVPIGRLGDPVQVVTQEIVASSSNMHQSVRNDGCIVSSSCANRFFDLFQDEHVRVIVLDEELHVMFDRLLATQNTTQILRKSITANSRLRSFGVP